MKNHIIFPFFPRGKTQSQRGRLRYDKIYTFHKAIIHTHFGSGSLYQTNMRVCLHSDERPASRTATASAHSGRGGKVRPTGANSLLL